MTGRLLDGENGHFGLVGITDVPFQGFIGAVRKSNLNTVQQVGKIAATATPGGAIDPDKGIDEQPEDNADQGDSAQ